MEGGTTFHFLDAAPTDALEVARDAADSQDVGIGGGPTMMRAFIAAGLVDHLHVVQVPILLGRGVRLWDGPEASEQQYDVEAVSTPSGVTHLTFTRSRGRPPELTVSIARPSRDRGNPRSSGAVCETL
jgi:dihydrofolate reductase